MSSARINLAHAPFVNSRPATRLALVLWLAAVGLLAWNGWHYWGYFTGSNDKSRRLAEIDRDTERLRRETVQLEKEIASLDLAQQNAQVQFVNERILDRTLSWSQLFERLNDLVPVDVRLLSLGPGRGGGRQGQPAARRDSAETSQAVPLRIQAEAKTDEAMLAFVDGLFAHPSFRKPNLLSEVRDQGVVRFELSVEYLREGTAPAARSEAAASAAGEEGAR
jgi:Tfp pilus assembly protein PilN